MEITLQDAVAIAEGANATLYIDYSGRGMYGARCLGFTVRSERDELRLGVAISRVLDEDAAEDMLERTTTDSMGMGTIVYFPGITLKEKA